jgi:hypothetical protein
MINSARARARPRGLNHDPIATLRQRRRVAAAPPVRGEARDDETREKSDFHFHLRLAAALSATSEALRDRPPTATIGSDRKDSIASGVLLTRRRS